jgi:hypothetical protein
MKQRVTRDDFTRMMSGAAVRIREQHRWLSQLDSAGDGFHGPPCCALCPAWTGAFAPNEQAGLKSSFHQAGWNVLAADGGASTSLLGTLFLGLSDALAPDSSSLDCASLARVFQAGLASVQKQTKAQPRGHQDAGAASVALMFEGFYRGLVPQGEGNHA